MKYRILWVYFFMVTTGFAQQKIVKSVASDAPYVEVKTDGIDTIEIQESDSNQLEMIISDADGLGVVENFSCNDYNCVLSIKTELRVDNPQTNKINQFPLPPPSNVSAVVKIPRNKKVTIYGQMIDVQTQGYDGILRILIDRGNVHIGAIKGITEVDLFAGTVYAQVNEHAWDIRSRKGTVTYNKEIQKSPFKRKRKKAHKLLVKSVNANVVLTEL